VLLASLALLLLYWQWRPIPAIVWHIENPVGAGRDDRGTVHRAG